MRDRAGDGSRELPRDSADLDLKTEPELAVPVMLRAHEGFVDSDGELCVASRAMELPAGARRLE